MARGGAQKDRAPGGVRSRPPERRYDVATFGEAMIRLSTPAGVRLPVAEALSVHVGGAESNVAADLAQLGRRTIWYSAVPDHAMGEAVVRRLAAAGVDVSHVKRVPGARVGVYYLEGGLDAATPEVIYDRQATAFSCITPEDLPLGALLDTRVLHVSGISAAVGAGPQAALVRLVEEAQRAGVLLSVDVNYRSRLWEADRASEALAPLAARADLLFVSASDASTLFRHTGDPETIVRALAERSQARVIVLTRGEQGVLASIDGAIHAIAAIPVQVIDRPGAGDALAAGVLDGVLDGDALAGVHRGLALAAHALTQRGDIVTTGRGDLERFMAKPRATIAR